MACAEVRHVAHSRLMSLGRVLLASAALFAGCASPDGRDASDGYTACDRDDSVRLPVLTIDPIATDPAISPGPEHVYVEPAGVPAGKLFVFLPGTSAPAAAYELVLRNAAAGGYHALALSYRNEIAVNDLCPVVEPGCDGAVRNEVLSGDDTSPLVEVGPADSIENRLIKALLYLGWTEYLDGDALRWSDITVAGHSQGGGHAAFLARAHEVHRAALFAATEPAFWTDDDLATPVDRFYGFVHADDPQREPFVASWERLGLLGEIIDIEDAALLFEDSRQLQTDLAAPTDNPHGAVVVDLHTPMHGDVPVYSDIWCLLVGP